MATSASIVYLGYEDEVVTDQNKHLVDSTTNKIGGLPVQTISLYHPSIAYMQAYSLIHFALLVLAKFGSLRSGMSDLRTSTTAGPANLRSTGTLEVPSDALRVLLCECHLLESVKGMALSAG